MRTRPELSFPFGGKVGMGVVRKFAFAFAISLLAAPPLPAQPTPSEMVDIPAGPFRMGSNEGPDDEKPAHDVNPGAYAIDPFAR